MPDLAPLSVHLPADNGWSGEPKGGIVVIQEAFGVNDHIEDVCHRFAAEGWHAVAPHLFWRTGDPALGYGDMTAVAPHFQALRADQILADVDVGLDHLDAAGFESGRVGVVGFCLGGTVALVTAVERTVGASVTFYGGGVAAGRFGFLPLIELAPGLGAPWLGLFGDQDHGIPVEEVEQLRAAADRATPPTEVVRYPEAGHGFHCDRRDSYHQPSADDAWQRTLAWFGRWLSNGRDD
jgi:carboxymethylenebutenolidase